jgi:hypothetical protein
MREELKKAEKESQTLSQEYQETHTRVQEVDNEASENKNEVEKL